MMRTIVTGDRGGQLTSNDNGLHGAPTQKEGGEEKEAPADSSHYLNYSKVISHQLNCIHYTLLCTALLSGGAWWW